MGDGIQGPPAPTLDRHRNEPAIFSRALLFEGDAFEVALCPLPEREHLPCLLTVSGGVSSEFVLCENLTRSCPGGLDGHGTLTVRLAVAADPDQPAGDPGPVADEEDLLARVVDGDEEALQLGVRRPDGMQTVRRGWKPVHLCLRELDCGRRFPRHPLLSGVARALPSAQCVAKA